MILGLDHTIFLVSDAADLGTVCARFATLGFTLTDRDDEGKDGAATAQRLICFADGSYVEILTIRDAQARARHRFAPLLSQGNGWADYSMATDSVSADQAKLIEAGLPASGPHEHTRRLADGRPWGVRLVLAGIGAGHPALPFLVEDMQGRDLRIPRTGIVHRNGVTGMAGVTVAVRDLDEAAPQVSLVLGPGDPLQHPTLGAGRGLRFRAGEAWVDAVEPSDARSPLARHVERGRSVCSVTFARLGPERPITLADDLGSSGL